MLFGLFGESETCSADGGTHRGVPGLFHAAVFVKVCAEVGVRYVDISVGGIDLNGTKSLGDHDAVLDVPPGSLISFAHSVGPSMYSSSPWSSLRKFGFGMYFMQDGRKRRRSRCTLARGLENSVSGIRLEPVNRTGDNRPVWLAAGIAAIFPAPQGKVRYLFLMLHPVPDG